MSRPPRGFPYAILCTSTALLLALPAALGGQGFRVPAATVQRVVSAEFAFCGRAEKASATELDPIAAEIRAAIEQQQRAVAKLAGDSLAAEEKVKNAQKKFEDAETKLGEAQVKRNATRDSLNPLTQEIARLEQADAPPGEPPRHAQLMTEETNLRSRIPFLQGEVAKVRGTQKNSGFFQGMVDADGPVADLRKAEKDLANVMEQLRAIRRQTLPLRFDATYQRLQGKVVSQNQEVDDLQQKVDEARKERDDAKKALEDFDMSALELAHEENLYLYEHLTRAQHCVDKRRAQLANAAPPVPTTMAGSANGKWGVFCRFTNEDYKELTDGGTFRVTFDGKGGVGGTYQSSNSNYGVSGSIGADGSAGGQGSGGGWSVNWSGRFSQIGGATVGNGGVNVTITDFGGGTCTGTWTVP